MQGEGGATRGRPRACRRPRRLRWGKRGLCDQEDLKVLADRVAELAAAEARRLVHTAAEIAESGQSGEAGVLEAIERAAQQAAAQIGLAAVAGVIDWAGRRTPARAPCPHGEHSARLVARRTKTIRTLLGALEIARGYYHCAACRGGFAPLDARLGVVSTSLSPGLARACALAGAEMELVKSSV